MGKQICLFSVHSYFSTRTTVQAKLVSLFLVYINTAFTLPTIKSFIFVGIKLFHIYIFPKDISMGI